MDPYEEKIAESHKLTLPDLVESEDETDSDSETEQEYSIEKLVIEHMIQMIPQKKKNWIFSNLQERDSMETHGKNA